MPDFETILKDYVETHLWVEEIGSLDLSEDAWDRARRSVSLFMDKAKPILKQAEKAGLCLDNIGYHFYLNRNGHGTGFWDGEYEPFGEMLSDICHEMGEVDVYVTDGKVYFQGWV